MSDIVRRRIDHHIHWKVIGFQVTKMWPTCCNKNLSGL